MKKIKIFIASSSELNRERREIEIFLGRKNKILLEKKYFLEIVLWEDYSDALSQTRMQDEFNHIIKEADVFVLLFATKVGRYTSEEFEVAFKQFKETNKPLIFTYFKETTISTGDLDKSVLKLLEFKNKLNVLGHFYSTFSTIEDLLLSFSNQLDKLFITAKKVESEKKESSSNEDKTRKVNVIKLLLCSPGDVQDERKSVSNAVFKFNQSFVEENGLFIKLIRWEDMAPQIGPGPQNVINKQIEKYHLFLGIMWNRFGTPTEVAASGSKEEYDMAIAMWKEKRRPWITFYFCDKPSNFVNHQQLEQKSKVLNFRTELNALGVVRSYLDVSEFEDKVYNDLTKIVSTPEFMELIKQV